MKAMLRRDRILFRRGLIPALVLTALLALAMALAGFSVFRSADEKTKPVQVAVVDEEGGLLSRFCINLVSSQSYIASLMDVTQLNKKQAVSGLDQGRFAAVIILPNGYTDQIMTGKKAKGQIVLSEAAAASSQMIASVASFGELLLAAGQNGIFAGEELIWDKGLPESVHTEFLDRSNDELLDVALNLYDEGVKAELLPYDGTSLTTAAYYAVTWLSLFLLLCGLFFPRLYTADAQGPLVTRLFSCGIGPKAFLSGKLLWPFVFRLPLTVLLLFGLSRFLPLTLNIGSVVSALFGVILATAMVSLGACALSSRKGWAGLLMGVAALGLFFCGGLVPRSMLPRAVAQIGRFTPSGAVLSCLKPIFGGQADWPSLLAGTLFALLLYLLAVRHLNALPRKGEENA